MLKVYHEGASVTVGPMGNGLRNGGNGASLYQNQSTQLRIATGKIPLKNKEDQSGFWQGRLKARI